nr:hypothetical protein [Tanacetum cinerariifolium]
MTSFNYRLDPLYPIKECSSCGALYTTDYCCSERILGDKIICDLDKTPDLSQRSPQNCPKCGNPVDGHYCQGCALLRKKFKEDLHHCCYGFGDPFDNIFCHQCTCELCGNGAHYGYNCPPKVPIILDPEPFNNQTIKELPPTMQSFDPKYDFVHDSPNVFDPPPQLPFYSCEFYGNDARYGHYCTPQIPFVYPEPCYNQDFDFPQDFHDFQQQYLCCKNYEQYTINHPIFNVQNDLFDSQNKIMEQLTSMCDMVGQFIQKKKEEKQIEEDQAANARYLKIPAYYDDDDDDDDDDYTFCNHTQ